MTLGHLAVAGGILIALFATFFRLKGRPVPASPSPIEPRSPLRPEERQKEWVDLLKLEYEKAADRYENLYRAIWQNFSYMAVVAGGILTFAGRDEKSAGFYFLALTPLFFWLVATFLPLDHYGNEIRTRLRKIEDDINRVYFPAESDPKLGHFKLFEGTRYKWRVRHAVFVFGAVLTVVWVGFGVVAGSEVVQGREQASQPQTLELQAHPLRVEVRDPGLAALRDSVAQLSRRIHTLDSLVRTSR